ncbi:hypothetical protein C2845_PM09G13280 [Panicum miliaceum]|uniref:Uncharacterized protein n=1 Tax=Panicum miliaceum TaxID=4540 RepID=A0A3L6S171_PANMI|nr:hypothetical protein C2845_PM09G13280 [Panicum miliaceum]
MNDVRLSAPGALKHPGRHLAGRDSVLKCCTGYAIVADGRRSAKSSRGSGPPLHTNVARGHRILRREAPGRRCPLELASSASEPLAAAAGCWGHHLRIPPKGHITKDRRTKAPRRFPEVPHD